MLSRWALWVRGPGEWGTHLLGGGLVAVGLWGSVLGLLLGGGALLALGGLGLLLAVGGGSLFGARFGGSLLGGGLGLREILDAGGATGLSCGLGCGNSLAGHDLRRAAVSFEGWGRKGVDGRSLWSRCAGRRAWLTQLNPAHDQQLPARAPRSRDFRVFSHFRALGPKRLALPHLRTMSCFRTRGHDAAHKRPLHRRADDELHKLLMPLSKLAEQAR